MPTRWVVRAPLATWAIGVLLASCLLLPLPAAAQRAAIDPRAVALTPDDLPAGFSVVPEATQYEPLPQSVGVQYRTEMRREPTLENLGSGPIVVRQILVRVDRLVPPPDLLAEVRDQLVQQQGLRPVAGAPNDGGTISLSRRDGDSALFAVGFVKENMVIFTIWGGLDSVVNLPGLLELAGISSARYDSVAGRGG